MNKNHEGYSDPTASKAIRKVIKHKRKCKGLLKNKDTLTYCICEVPGFKQFVE